MNNTIKNISVLLLTALVTAGAVLLIGPQILIIVPLAIIAGIVLAIKRSFFSLVCFGYPLTFGLVSALIGYAEMTDYTRTTAFAVSIAIGLVGAGLIAAGLWKGIHRMTSAARGPGTNEGITF